MNVQCAKIRLKYRSFLLTKGQLLAGNTKAWLMTNSRKELSFSDHTHSEYALISHTHSNYALTSHTHSGYARTNHTHSQYVTEVDINQMIEDVIDSYVPTIQTMGQVGIFEPNFNNLTITITVSSSVKLFMVWYTHSRVLSHPLAFVKISGIWYPNETSENDLTITASSNRITLKSSGRQDFYQYPYFYL